jgi:hypothetical protein
MQCSKGAKSGSVIEGKSATGRHHADRLVGVCGSRPNGCARRKRRAEDQAVVVTFKHSSSFRVRRLGNRDHSSAGEISIADANLKDKHIVAIINNIAILIYD